MKQKIIAVLMALLMSIFIGCSQKNPGAAAVEPTPTAAPTQIYIQADYAIYTFGSPCGPGVTYIESHSRSNTAYTGSSHCDGTAITNTYSVTEASFRSAVYADDYMALHTNGGAYSVISIPASAPAGTVNCYKSANLEHLICKNAAGVITYREEHPSVRGVLDADGSAVLLNYNESSTPF